MQFENGSASAAERVIACPASLVFPQVDHESDHAARGHVIHRFGKAVLTGTPLPVALAAVKDSATRETCASIDWRKIGGDLHNVQCEVAYAVDVRQRTSRLIGVDVGRQYGPLGEWEVPGALDLMGEKDGGGLAVIDVKTGFLDVTSPAENGQGLFFSSALILAGAADVEFRISHLKPSGKVWLESATHTALDVDTYLDEYESALVEAKEARRVYLAGGTPPVTEGPWCRYCPAFDSCPAKQKLVRSMLPELQAVDAAIANATPEQKGKAWELAHDRIKPLLNRVLDALKDSARRAPVPLADGRELRESTYPQERLHAESILALARNLGATDEQIADCYRETTISKVLAAKPRGRRAA